MAEAELMNVEVAYARPDNQVIVPLKVPPETTVEEAIHLAGLLESFPEIDLGTNKVGVFGKLTKLGAALKPGDRVEVYRALIADPKQVRKKRAAEKSEK